MNDYGIKVSAEGVDVKDAAPEDIIYSSKYSNFKIHSILEQEIVAPAGMHDTSVSIDNPLPYASFFMPFVENSAEPGYWYEGKAWCGISDTSGSTIMPIVSYNPGTNQFDLLITTFAGFTGGTFTFRIVVFVDIITGAAEDIASLGDYGLKVSKEGKSVFKDPDSDMSMSTKFRNLTIFDSNTAKTTAAGGHQVVISHNLGYVPIVLARQQLPASPTNYQRLPAGYYYGSGQDASLAWLKVTDDSLIITDMGYTDNRDINYDYIIFNEQLV